MWILATLAAYLIVGLLLHHFIFPVQAPDYQTYFKTGVSFRSNLEGLTQQVVKAEQDTLTAEITLDPGAPGPVTHFHERFDEVFTVSQGTLSMQVGEEIRHLSAGETIVIPRGVAHRPFNETDSAVVVTSKLPVDFAYCLSQIYPFWDENEANSKPPKVLFQLAVFGSRFDSFPTQDAPPQPILKTLKFLLAPTARILGYQFYKEAYAPQ